MRQLMPLAGLGLLALLAPPGVRAQGFALAVEGGYYDMTNARNSAKAVFGGTAGGALFGVAARTGLGRSFFLGGGVRLFQRTGERVFVADANSPAFRLGHPLEVRVMPVYLLAGYRFSPESRLVPYVGLGAGITSYREESEVAGEVSEESASKPSGHLVAGLELGRSRLRFALEGMYTVAPDTIGQAGVSQVYGESDVGGLSVVGRVVFVP